MTNRERMLCALSHKEGDRVPLDFGAGRSCKFHVLLYKRLLDHFGIKEEVKIGNKVSQLATASDKFLEVMGTDVRAIPGSWIKSTGGYTQEDWEDDNSYYWKDNWGTTMRMPKSSPLHYDMVDYPLLDRDGKEADDANYNWPNPSKLDPSTADVARKYQQDGYLTAFGEHFANGFLQTGPKVYGFDQWLMMLAAEKERVHNFNEKLLSRKLEYYDNVLDVLGDTVDVIEEADDLGTQVGPFISRDMFREMILPYWKAVWAHVHKKAPHVKIMLHSCGSVSHFLSDLIENGLQILNPVQTGAAQMSPGYLKKEFGKDLVFWGGGINTQSTLPRGTKEQIREEVKRTIAEFGPDGGFVFAAIHNMQADVPTENFINTWEAYKEFSGY